MPVYNDDLINKIRARNAEYSRYAAPQWDALQYVLAMSNIPPDVAPDDYGVLAHMSSSWNQWWQNHYESLMNSEYGRYTRADLDEQSLRAFRDVLKKGGLDDNWQDLDPSEIQGYSNVVDGKMNDFGLNKKILSYIYSGRDDLALKEIDLLLNEVEGVDPYSDEALELYEGTVAEKKRMALAWADGYRKAMDRHEAKVHSWYQYKDRNTNFDFTDIDTYLYKLPGLLGSSSATIGTDIPANAASVALSRLGPWGVVAGFALNTAAALYSRKQESLGEVYANYKDAVKQLLEKSKADEKILQDARAYMLDYNERAPQRKGNDENGNPLFEPYYTQEQIDDDDFVYDQILNGNIPIDNYQLLKAMYENRRGINSLYMDNMALSAFDIAQSAIEVVPFGFRGLGVYNKMLALGEKTGINAVKRGITGLKKGIVDRIDDVVAYGLDKAEDMSKLTWRHAVLDLTGRMALSSVLEGGEEGTQYIKGLNYINGLFTPDSNLALRWVDNMFTGARAIFAALTPWDPLYSDDQEFMDNFKGGALLGGLMTGGMRAVANAANIPGQLKANKLIAGLYADNLAVKDRVRKDILYSQMSGNGRFAHLNQSFDYLKTISPEGITEDEIDSEVRRANEIHNLRNSSQYLNDAKSMNIDPRTNDYDTYVALRAHYYDAYNESVGNRKAAVDKMKAILSDEESQRYIAQLTERVNRALNRSSGSINPQNTVDEETVSNMMLYVAYKRGYDNIIELFDNDGEILKEILANLNYKTNHTDVRGFGKKARELKKKTEETEGNKAVLLNLKILSALGISEDQFLIPAKQLDMISAAELVVIAELDSDRSATEFNLFAPDPDKLKSDNEKEVKDRIQRYKDAIDRGEAYVVTLDDIANGRDINRANHNTTTYSPPPITNPTGPNNPNNPNNPNQPPTPPAQQPPSQLSSGTLSSNQLPFPPFRTGNTIRVINKEDGSVRIEGFVRSVLNNGDTVLIDNYNREHHFKWNDYDIEIVSPQLQQLPSTQNRQTQRQPQQLPSQQSARQSGQTTPNSLFERTETRKDGSTIKYSLEKVNVKKKPADGVNQGLTEVTFDVRREDSRSGKVVTVSGRISAFEASEEDIDFKVYAEYGTKNAQGNPITADADDINEAKEQLRVLRTGALNDKVMPVAFRKLIFLDDGRAVADMVDLVGGTTRVPLTEEAALKYRQLFLLSLPETTTQTQPALTLLAQLYDLDQYYGESHNYTPKVGDRIHRLNIDENGNVSKNPGSDHWMTVQKVFDDGGFEVENGVSFPPQTIEAYNKGYSKSKHAHSIIIEIIPSQQQPLQLPSQSGQSQSSKRNIVLPRYASTAQEPLESKTSSWEHYRDDNTRTYGGITYSIGEYGRNAFDLAVSFAIDAGVLPRRFRGYYGKTRDNAIEVEDANEIIEEFHKLGINSPFELWHYVANAAKATPQPQAQQLQPIISDKQDVLLQGAKIIGEASPLVDGELRPRELGHKGKLNVIIAEKDGKLIAVPKDACKESILIYYRGMPIFSEVYNGKMVDESVNNLVTEEVGIVERLPNGNYKVVRPIKGMGMKGAFTPLKYQLYLSKFTVTTSSKKVTKWQPGDVKTIGNVKYEDVAANSYDSIGKSSASLSNLFMVYSRPEDQWVIDFTGSFRPGETDVSTKHWGTRNGRIFYVVPLPRRKNEYYAWWFNMDHMPESLRNELEPLLSKNPNTHHDKYTLRKQIVDIINNHVAASQPQTLTPQSNTENAEIIQERQEEIAASEAHAQLLAKESATKNTTPTQPSEAQPVTPEKSESPQPAKVEDAPTNSGQFGLVSDQRMEELKLRLRNKWNQLNSGIDPETLAIGIELAAGYLDRGIKTFVDFAKVMINDLGDTVRPYLKAFYNGARDMPEVVQSGLSNDMTPYEEVRNFDVMAFDKQPVEPPTPPTPPVLQPELQPEPQNAIPVQDNYSHELNYRLKDSTGQSIPFQGMEEYANNEELAEISTDPDFIQAVESTGEFVVRPYTDPRTGLTRDAIYLTFEKDGKKYVASVLEVESLQRYLNNNGRLPFLQINQILENLRALRDRIISLCKQIEGKPNFKVVPISVTTTTGQFVNEKNPDKSPKNRNLLDSRLFPIKDPFLITPDNALIGITTGGRGGMYIRYRGQSISIHGHQLGQPMWIIKVPRKDGGTDTKLVKLNYATFKDQPEIVDFIMDLLLTDSSTYIDKNGFNTGIEPEKLLRFIVNYGTQTIVNPEDKRLTLSQIDRLLDKQFYRDGNNVVIGRTTYTMSDLLSDESIRNKAKDYIRLNFHWAIDENDLSTNYLGSDQGSTRNTVFAPAKAALLGTSLFDKIVMVPGKLEFGLRELGLTKDSNGRKQVDTTTPKGISAVGWYIKQGILLTDISDKLTNANMYVGSVGVIERNTTTTLQTTTPNTPEGGSPYQGMSIETPEGTITGEDVLRIFDLLNGKVTGPSMEVPVSTSDVMPDETQTMDVQQATEWLQHTLGVTPEIVPTVIDVTESGNAVVGRVTEDSILLSELAPIGTEYHEAWHRVSQLLISDKKRDKIYKKYRKQGLSDKEIDEMLAEDFRRFLLEEALNYDYETKNWFRRIIDFIKLWARTGSYALANIYTNINRAKYAGVQPSKENISRFRKIYSGEGPNLEINGYKFKNISTVKQLDDVVKSLEYAFFLVAFAEGKTINYADLRNDKPRFDRLKLILQAKLAKDPNNALAEVVEKFDDVFMPMLTSKLALLNIRAIDRDESSRISDMEEGALKVDIGLHTVEGMNISIKDNAPAEVKFFFQTVPAYVTGQDGKATIKMDPITGFPQFIDSNTAWIRVIKDLCGCRTVHNVYNKILLLANTGDTFYQSLLNRFLQLILDNNSLNEAVAMNAEALLTKIMTTITSDVNNFVTAKISRDDLTQQVSMSLVDNTVDTRAMTYPRLWSQQLFMSSGLFKYEANGKITSNPEAKRRLNIVITNLKNIVNSLRNGQMIANGKPRDLRVGLNLNIVKKILIDQLNSVGIGIDMQTLNRMLASGDFGSPLRSNYDLMRDFVTNVSMFGGLLKIIETLEYIYNSGNMSAISTPQGFIDPRSVWNNSGFVKYMAQQYAAVHSTDKSLSSLGPDGSKYYMVSLNNFAKDRINEIVNDEETRNQLLSVTYNQHSILLRSAAEGNKDIAIETLINFKDETSQDTGRDYFSITDREDYLAKMTAAFNDRIIFPTVADKKTYHFIRGLKLFHEALRLQGNSDSFGVLYGDNALNTLIGYCYDEYEQIKLCLRQIDDDPSHVKEVDGKMVHYNEDGTINQDWLEPDRRIKNFHTPNKFTYKDEDGNEHTRVVEGNGARFLFLTGIYVNETNKDGKVTKKFINFNDPMKSAKENLKTAEDYFFNMSVETLKAFLSSLINERVKLEIQTAKDLGLITADDNNSVKSLRNVLLDSKELLKRINRYRQFDPANAEGFAIFDMLADYTINSIVSIQEIEKVFSGAPAYYKVKYDKYGIVDVSIDKIKRLGSLTSTGLNNRLDFIKDVLDSDEYTVAELKDHEIRDKLFSELERMFARSNLKETIQEMEGQGAWEKVKNLPVKEILEIYPEAAKMALAAAKKDVAGYKGGVNVADAAVYISPRMAKNLLRMRGIWSKEIKEAFDILTNPDTADTWEADPRQYAKANKVILNAMKYVAFGTRLNEIPGLGIPYFNKMALFPLFKSIATGDIRKLYDRMTAPGREIDMVMFDSAVKAGSRSPLKMYRQATDKELELKDGQTVLSAELTELLENDQAFRPDDLDKLVTYKQKYKYIRLQLETNPHTHEELMLGTQFVKVGMSNLRDDDTYGVGEDTASGRMIKQTITRCLNKLSDIGREKILSRITDDDGNIDVAKLAKMLQDDARDSDANDNILSGLNVKDGETELPLDAMSDNKWLESRFSAMIADEVVDVHLPGGAFIQRSAFGLEATSHDVITENMINDGKPLLMINEKDGSMDAVVSINLFKHIIPDYHKKTFKQARQWLLDHNIIGLNAEANAIGYRIPTQSIASISALRFVDVLPEIMGDTIVLPEGFTKLTGSDFD